MTKLRRRSNFSSSLKGVARKCCLGAPLPNPRSFSILTDLLINGFVLYLQCITSIVDYLFLYLIGGWFCLCNTVQKPTLDIMYGCKDFQNACQACIINPVNNYTLL